MGATLECNKAMTRREAMTSNETWWGGVLSDPARPVPAQSLGSPPCRRGLPFQPSRSRAASCSVPPPLGSPAPAGRRGGISRWWDHRREKQQPRRWSQQRSRTGRRPASSEACR
ncbi:unnamed protein product [Musa hybrid cultivar]